MEKKGDHYTAKISIDSNTNAIAFLFLKIRKTKTMMLGILQRYVFLKKMATM